jgi:hypothetical protein
MVNKTRLKRFLALFDPAGTRKYITQITLILLSLFIATSVDRCREANKNQEKLREYMQAVLVDIQGEKETCQINLHDCKRDIQGLTNTLEYVNKPDSLEIALTSFSSVFWRGVFRTFSPTTFETMGETGDITLLKDLKLRNKLSSVFAFRRTVVKQDLEEYDRQTNLCAEKMGQHIDLTRWLYSQPFDESCIFDRAGFLQSPHNEVFILLRVANLRAFHLENAIEDLEDAEKELTAFIKTL